MHTGWFKYSPWLYGELNHTPIMVQHILDCDKLKLWGQKAEACVQHLICITERTQTHKSTHHSKETSPHHSLLLSQAEDVVSLLCVFVDFWQLLTESSDCPHVADSLLCQLHTNVILLGLHWLKIKLSTSKFTLSASLIKLPKEVKHLYHMYTKLRVYYTTHCYTVSIQWHFDLHLPHLVNYLSYAL